MAPVIERWTLDMDGSAAGVQARLALAVVQGLGRDGLAECLLAELASIGRFDHCTVYQFERIDGADLRCTVIDAASRHRLPTAWRTSSMFAERFAQLDINGRSLGEKALAGRTLASHLLADDVEHPEYRQACYRRNDLIDRFSLLAVDGSARGAVALNLYRSRRHGLMPAAERQMLLRHGPLLATVAARHVELQRRTASIDEHLRCLPESRALTPRERQVCALLLDGRTLAAVAEALTVRPSTVITLKKRAFARLGVRNREALLRRLALSRPASSPVPEGDDDA